MQSRPTFISLQESFRSDESNAQEPGYRDQEFVWEIVSERPYLGPVYRSVWLGNCGVETRRLGLIRLVFTPKFPNQTDR